MSWPLRPSYACPVGSGRLRFKPWRSRPHSFREALRTVHKINKQLFHSHVAGISDSFVYTH